MPSKERPLRLIFMGMGGLLSSQPLNHLLQAGFKFDAVIMAAAQSSMAWRRLRPPAYATRSVPVLTPTRSIMQLSWEHDIALYESGNLDTQAACEALQELAPDVVLVSCFAHRVPARLLHTPRYGFLNLHPSRLPHYRGPYPHFWQLRDGLNEIGLTVHRMSEAFDKGPIALQGSVRLEDGLNAGDIDRLVGNEGGKLFVETLRAIASGRFTVQPQQGEGSYQGRPQESDFELDRTWTARRAFNFMRGTSDWGQPYVVNDGTHRRLVRRALAYDADGVQTSAVQKFGEQWRIQFNPGTLDAL